jgi:hypothetical protein
MPKNLSHRHISFLLYLYSHCNGRLIGANKAVELEEAFCGGEVEGLIPDLVCPFNLLEVDDEWCTITDSGISLIDSIMSYANSTIDDLMKRY